MASFELLRHVSIGQYIPTGSPLHRLDPRAKLLGFAFLVGAVVFVRTYAVALLLCLFILGLVKLARLSVHYIWASIRPALPLILLFTLLQLFFYRGTGAVQVLFAWKGIQITAEAVHLVVVSLLRFFALLMLTSLLTNTTTVGALTYGLERLLHPLDALGFPGHELALVGTIALRFLPLLGEQMEAILKAQASRGVNVAFRGRWHLVHNARRVASLIIPLFVDAFRRAEEMILAMEARCYHGGKGRTYFKTYSFGVKDALALVLAVAIFLAVLLW